MLLSAHWPCRLLHILCSPLRFPLDVCVCVCLFFPVRERVSSALTHYIANFRAMAATERVDRAKGHVWLSVSVSVCVCVCAVALLGYLFWYLFMNMCVCVCVLGSATCCPALQNMLIVVWNYRRPNSCPAAFSCPSAIYTVIKWSIYALDEPHKAGFVLDLHKNVPKTSPTPRRD